MNVTRTSIVTGITRTYDIPVTEEEITRWEDEGGLIQHVMPELSDDDREFLITGISKDEWEAIYNWNMEEYKNE